MSVVVNTKPYHTADYPRSMSQEPLKSPGVILGDITTGDRMSRGAAKQPGAATHATNSHLYARSKFLITSALAAVHHYSTSDGKGCEADRSSSDCSRDAYPNLLPTLPQVHNSSSRDWTLILTDADLRCLHRQRRQTTMCYLIHH